MRNLFNIYDIEKFKNEPSYRCAEIVNQQMGLAVTNLVIENRKDFNPDKNMVINLIRLIFKNNNLNHS